MLQKTLLAAILTVATGSAFAAGPVANLKIDGKVTPPTCTVNGAEQGELVADLGAISPGMLNKTSRYTIPVVTVSLSVSCNAQTYLTFIPTDTYAGHGTGPSRSNLVSDKNKSALVGDLFYLMSNMKVDGKDAYYGRQINGLGKRDFLPLNGFISAWTTLSQKDVDVSTFKLASGKVFSADFTVNGQILSTDALKANGVDLSERVDFVSETVLAFNFGI